MGMSNSLDLLRLAGYSEVMPFPRTDAPAAMQMCEEIPAVARTAEELQEHPADGHRNVKR